VRQDRYDEARVLAEALQDGLQEVREDVTSLVSAEVERVGLTASETRAVIRDVVTEELERREAERSRFARWLPAAVGLFAGAALTVAVLVATGTISF